MLYRQGKPARHSLALQLRVKRIMKGEPAVSRRVRLAIGQTMRGRNMNDNVMSVERIERAIYLKRNSA